MNGTDTGLLAAFTLGLLGSSHCLVMCGGISAALGMGADPARRNRSLVLFQLGRVTTYVALGAGLGAMAGALATTHPMILPSLRIASGLLLVAMGLYVASWWTGLTWLERGGKWLWQRVEPHARARLPISRSVDALAVGLFWGFLPCGLIYTALAWTATAGHWGESALLMGLFGLGTTPAMLATGLAGQRLSRLLSRRGLRAGAGILLIAAGAWTSWIAIQHAGHQGHTNENGANNGAADHSHHHH